MEQHEGQTTETPSVQNLPNHPVDMVATEKQVPQSVVNRIVGETKKEAYEQGVKAGKASTHQPTPTQGMDSETSATSGLTQEQIKTLVKEQIDQQAEAQRDLQMRQAAQEFLGKLKPGEEKYADFNETINSVNWTKVPAVLDLANLTENTSDVVYELAKNPQKAISLNNLAQVNPQAALAETKKLAESIKQNQHQHPLTNPPLTPLTPSVTKTDNGSRTVSELRQQSWLRG